MKKIKIFTLALALFTLINNINGQNCADSLNIYKFTFNNKKYEIVKELKSWVNAAACAVQRGGYLVQIDNQAEQDAIYNAIRTGANISTTYTTVDDGGGIAYVWIGATDKSTEGTWIWDGNNDNTGINFWTGQGSAGTGNGSAVNGLFNKWGGSSVGNPKEPDNYANQDAAAIGLSGWPNGTGSYGIAGEWNDINIANTLYYVIEYDNQTGFNENKNNFFDLSITSNIGNKSIKISTNNINNLKYSISIYNVLGNKFIEKSVNINEEIDLSQLTNGVYFVTIASQKEILLKKKIVL